MDFSKKLVSWYQVNKRDLPWRNTTNAYYIWLSEIILQQTRVAQGLPYYVAFVKAYPKIENLANAPEDDVLKMWQGLGYYSRARNLHFTAKEITVNYGGEFPNDYQQILNLKGVGPYTAAAISSFAFGLPYAVVDGNVCLRVLFDDLTDSQYWLPGWEEIDKKNKRLFFLQSWKIYQGVKNESGGEKFDFNVF